MLYVQHQYEDTYYRSGADWRFELAALQGSSYLKLPRALVWAVGNANYHHVHHLSARIPNYRLRAAHEQQPMFAATPVVTLRSGIAALRLKLWDEERGCLVGYSAVRSATRLSCSSRHAGQPSRCACMPGTAASASASASSSST